MKANQAYRNDKAEVGVGTLIVFIAMVLVAAVAAAVLINTTGSLQQRAQQTGTEATQDVSSNLKVLNVYGERLANGDVDELKFHVSLSAGATDMDLEQLVIRYSNGATALTMSWMAYNATADPTDDTKFMANWVRGDGTGLAGASVMQAGDLVELHIALSAANDIPVRTPVEITMIPESGSPVRADFKTPSTYGSDTTVTLR